VKSNNTNILLWILTTLFGLISCSVAIKTDKMDGEFPGIKNIIADGELTQVIFVHGMGKSEIGFSSHIREGLVNTLKLKSNGAPNLFKIHPEKVAPGYAYLQTWEYMNSQNKTIRFYELTWSPITRELKERTFSADAELDAYRQNLNAALKDFVNDYLSDPFLYIGKYGVSIRSVVTQTICHVMADTNKVKLKKVATCDQHPITKNTQRLSGGIAIVSHSLGSKLIYDSLYNLASTSEKLPQARSFITRIQSVYMMANQITFLELAHASSKKELESVRDNSMQQFIKIRSRLPSKGVLKPVHIVAFTDPDDMLSYPLPQGYCKGNGKSVYIRCVNVLINNNNQSLFGQIANPVYAHTGYRKNRRVIAMISCGSDKIKEKDCYKNAGVLTSR
jgi:hypothetical protein